MDRFRGVNPGGSSLKCAASSFLRRDHPVPADRSPTTITEGNTYYFEGMKLLKNFAQGRLCEGSKVLAKKRFPPSFRSGQNDPFGVSQSFSTAC